MGNYCNKNSQELEKEIDQEISLQRSNYTPPKRHYTVQSPDRAYILEEKYRSIQAKIRNTGNSNTDTKAKSSSTVISPSFPSTASNSIISQKMQSKTETLSGDPLPLSQNFIYPAPGTHGQYYQIQNLITVYCPIDFEIFQVRVNNVMTLLELKKRIAKKYQTFQDNIIVIVGDKEYRGEKKEDNENSLLIRQDIGIDEHTVVKVNFKVQPACKIPQQKRSKSYNYSSSVVVTTNNDNGDRIRGITQYLREETEFGVQDSNNQKQQNQQFQDKMHTTDMEEQSLSCRILKLNGTNQTRNFHNAKFITRLQESASKMKDQQQTVTSQQTQRPYYKGSFISQTDTATKSKLMIEGTKLTRNESVAQVTTVVVSSGALEKTQRSFKQPLNIQVKSSSIYSNSSFNKRSFIEELNHPASEILKETKQARKAVCEPVQLGALVSAKNENNNSQIFKIKNKKHELNEEVKKRMLGHLASSQASRMHNQ